MKALLAYKTVGDGAKDPYTSLLPIGLGYINAMLREGGIDSKAANLSSFNWKETGAIIGEERPDILGLSIFTHNRFASLRVAGMAKKANPSCLTVAGGPHATHRAAQILRAFPEIDAVVVGEGEETFLELARLKGAGKLSDMGTVAGLAFRNGADIVLTPRRPPVRNLDSIPAPAPHLEGAIGIDLHRQLEFIITSRGCPASCRFCSSPLFWGSSLRFRSPRAIVDEIRYIRDRHGLIYFSFRDDTFTADRGRVIELCKLLLAEKVHIMWNCQSRVNAVDSEMLVWMRRAGCECVQYGIESGSGKVLKILGKRITTAQMERAACLTRDAGINLSIYLITGVPGETEADVQATIRLINRMRPHDGQVSPLAYYPGTALADEAVEAGMLQKDIFETDRREGFFVRDEPVVSEWGERILEELWKAGDKGRFTDREFAAQEKNIGWCHAGAVARGEFYAEQGDFYRAERACLDITVREPENPWGWLSLGELYARAGRRKEAAGAFRRLIDILPSHVPAQEALMKLKG